MLSSVIINAITKVLLSGLVFVFLQSCSNEIGPTSIAPENSEIVKLVLYYSDGDVDWKTVGEWILIDSGELLHVRRNKIRPVQCLIINEWNDKLLEKIETPPLVGKVALNLDRQNGVICNEKNCTTLYSICPPRVEMKLGKKCVGF